MELYLALWVITHHHAGHFAALAVGRPEGGSFVLWTRLTPWTSAASRAAMSDTCPELQPWASGPWKQLSPLGTYVFDQSSLSANCEIAGTPATLCIH